MAAKGIHRRLAIEVTDSLRNRFWGKVDKCAANDCWNWLGAFRNGYGAIKHQGRVLGAHRVAFVLANGEPGGEHLIAHTCDNRACCNPSHLEAATPQKNVRDAFARGRIVPAKGEACGSAQINEQLVARIWSLKRTGLSGRKIADETGATYDAVKHVLAKKSWKHLVPEWAK